MAMENIDNLIEAYFEREENLHRLREKILRLDGYILWSESEKEVERVKKACVLCIEQDKRKHAKEMENLEKKYSLELKELQKTHRAVEHASNEELRIYKARVAKELEQVEMNREELERWRNDYGQLASAYESFLALASHHREALEGIFGGCDTPLDFFCGAMQKAHLEQLWDYVSGELGTSDEDEHEDLFLLSTLFDFSFNAVNRSQREPLFKRFAVPQGAVFDGDTMGRTSDSPQLGRVKQLVFAGFAHEVTGNVVRRSLVRLE